MPLSRRHFLSMAPTAAAAACIAPASVNSAPPRVVRPPRLRPGSTVGLISPGGAIFEPGDLDYVRETLATLELRTRLGGRSRVGLPNASTSFASRSTRSRVASGTTDAEPESSPDPGL